MIRPTLLATAALVLSARLALADPEFRVTYDASTVRVEIAGSYEGARYTVSRSTTAEGPFAPITAGDVLCTGQCYASDPGAEPGRTYWYRFNLVTAAGAAVRYGPYRATIAVLPAIQAVASPNPGHGETVIDLVLAGGAQAPQVATELALYDVTGRRRVLIQTASLAPGRTRVRWNGRLDDGRPAPAGIYFLRFSAADGRASVTRIARIR
jgi:hypothetical protein